MLQETACRLVKSAGDDSILDQILSDGVKATRKCKGKNNGINGNKFGVICPKTTTCGKQISAVYFSSYVATSFIVQHVLNTD